MFQALEAICQQIFVINSLQNINTYRYGLHKLKIKEHLMEFKIILNYVSVDCSEMRKKDQSSVLVVSSMGCQNKLAE